MMEAQQDCAVHVENLIKDRFPRMGLLSLQQLYVPSGAPSDVSHGDDRNDRNRPELGTRPV